MSDSFRTCPDGHRCENGSSCMEHPKQEGKYYCDCGTGSGDFAGLFCEYEAETYCSLEQETTSDWFCTNEGTCVLSTDNAPEAQWNCDCPADFDGPHCQFIRGNVPRDWPGYDFDPVTGTLAAASSSRQRQKEGGLHIAVSIFIGLVIFAFVALVGFFVVRKIRNRDGTNVAQNATRDPSEGLKLEADGSVLQEVMQSFARTPNSTIHNNPSEEHSVEMGSNGYSDNPRRPGRNGANGNMI
mmetsp:Transcript_26201/g.56186  ORF Transcript_26201/g.56186 Transcript_26201/m.56186 type:complete len:241 (-) Transcript_26201:376-1098(-)|eukprot:CAMPEP_0201126794 /NCGR_PEP_ID=MMETSP0850-20130426/27488_1 /ASSEMBLY_ACC=CAM_ASM_000622 /TAXON_ID=183588 /ORGANISM="Pseudo-nitzschia fraudulenta, Strain WWA7" /LENGTH=240 /DNA_ID=CAMNT_0047395375 /DNA_START=131 /DNA_END=853 /DNA_ORIENTATION=-